MHYRLNGM